MTEKITRNRWTTRQDETLLKMAGNFHVKEIAEKTQHSVSAVQQRACLLSVSLSRRHVGSSACIAMKSAGQIEAKRLEAIGLTQHQIALVMQIPKQSVKQLLSIQ